MKDGCQLKIEMLTARVILFREGNHLSERQLTRFKQQVETMKESVTRWRNLGLGIRGSGLWQPIIVADSVSGGLHVVAGRKRLQAFKELGIDTIPCVSVEKLRDDLQWDLGFDENATRTEFTAEERRSYIKFRQQFAAEFKAADEAKAEDPGLMTEDEREAIIRDLSISTRKGAKILGCSDKTLWKWRQDRGLSKNGLNETTAVSSHETKLQALPNGRPANEERRKVEEATGASRATVYRDIAKVNAESKPPTIKEQLDQLEAEERDQTEEMLATARQLLDRVDDRQKIAKLCIELLERVGFIDAAADLRAATA